MPARRLPRRSRASILAAVAVGSLALSAAVPSPALAQAARAAAPAPSRALPPRAIRRDLRRTDMIRRAYAAGTRDSTGRPGAKYWQLFTNYSIDARLDTATSIVSGHERISFANASDDPMDAIVLRLDQNIFRANVPRAETVTEITDGMQLTRLVVNGATIDLSAPPTRGANGRFGPDVREEITQTVARIPLATPIPAGGTATVEAEWNFRVPRADGMRGLRMGRWGDTLYQVAQWYPRVAMYDDLRDGHWDTDPYLGTSEFYNNFGHFDVRIDVPAGYVVGSTGVLQNPAEVLTATERERLSHVLESDSTRGIVEASEFGPGKATAGAAGGRLVWHFVADTVGDVAWATSNRFVWDATRATIPGGGTIPVDVMYLPGHAQGANGRPGFAQAGPILQHALSFYSRLWMPYAFPKLTMVDGPEGGMEYPMFIMSGPGAADHETGHQWWPMMVGVNETWYGFMDEGFNQYMNILSGADARHTPPRLDGLGQSYGRISGDEQEAPLMWDANYGGPMYGFQAYGKAPMMLSMLGGVVGDSAVLRAMSDYAHAWRFKHPSPWDYANFMSGALHRDLGWFWYYWLFTTEGVDGAIDHVTTAGRRTTVTVRQDGGMPSPVVLAVTLAPTGPAIRVPSNGKLVDANTVELTWPVDVWFDGRRTFTATLDFGGRAVQQITLDPHGRFPDADVADNVWKRK